jgi:isopenicillin N synthase-like dioxygenase
MSTLRLLKYHDCEGKDFGEGYMRAGYACSFALGSLSARLTVRPRRAHADFDVMTFLFQRKGQSGLELCPGRKISTEFGYGDTWVPVDVEEGAIVINVGCVAIFVRIRRAS